MLFCRIVLNYNLRFSSPLSEDSLARRSLLILRFFVFSAQLLIKTSLDEWWSAVELLRKIIVKYMLVSSLWNNQEYLTICSHCLHEKYSLQAHGLVEVLRCHIAMKSRSPASGIKLRRKRLSTRKSTASLFLGQESLDVDLRNFGTAW